MTLDASALARYSAAARRTGWLTGVTRQLICGLVAVLAAAHGWAGDTDPKGTAMALPAGCHDKEIQRALDSLPATGGEVILPAGVIEVREPIVMSRDHESLRGAGVQTVLRLADNANCPVLILGEPVNFPAKSIHGLAVSNLSIDGNRQGQTRELWHTNGEGSEIRNNGITIQRVENSAVENITVRRCRSGGLVTTRSVRRLIVRGLDSSENEFDGLAAYETEDCFFADLVLHDNPGAGISLDLAFNHNQIRNARLANNDLGIFMRASHENKLVNVIISRSHHYGVFMAEATETRGTNDRSARYAGCTHNVFSHLDVQECGGAAVRINDSTCANNVLLEPQFVANEPGAVSLAPDTLITVTPGPTQEPTESHFAFLQYRTVPFPMQIAGNLCKSLVAGCAHFQSSIAQ